MPTLAGYPRVLALILFPGAFLSVQNAMIAREMAFRKLMIASLMATLLSGATGVTMAMKGMGRMGASQQMVNQLSLCAILFVTLRWRPRLLFSLHGSRGCFPLMEAAGI